MKTEIEPFKHGASSGSMKIPVSPGGRLGPWPKARRLATILAWVATLAALYYAFSLWRGKRAWEHYRREVESKGESLRWSDLIPAGVTPERNFAATPFLTPLFDYSWVESQSAFVWKSPNEYRRTVEFAPEFGWTHREATLRKLALRSEPQQGNEPATTEQEKAKNALTALEQYGTVLAELDQASKRPEARFAIHYEDGALALLPHLEVLDRLVEILQVRAGAELALGNTERGFEDTMLILCLANSVKDEPFLPSQSTRRHSVILAVQCLQDAVDRGAWQQDQLRKMQTQLQKVDLLGDFERSLRAERIGGNQLIDLTRTTRSPSFLFESGSDLNSRTAKPQFLLRLLPSGWFYRSQVEYDELYQRVELAGIDGKSHRVYPSVVEESAQAEKSLMTGIAGWVIHDRFIAAQLLASHPVRMLVEPFGRAQVLVDQATVVCALAQYRTGHGIFPEQLNALVPDFAEMLPSDVLSGDSYKYKRIDSDRFLLYSVGWNGKDDGGVFRGSMKPSEFNKLPSDKRKDDLVWGVGFQDR
jgi:hypothetical protein